MKSTRLAKRTALLMSGLLLPVFGACLPDNYFALSARNITLAIADSLVGAAVNPFLASLQLSDDQADTTDPMATMEEDAGADTGG